MPSERVQRRVDALLDDADSALARRDWQSALESAEAALGFDPDNSEAGAFIDAAKRALAAAIPDPSEQAAGEQVSDAEQLAAMREEAAGATPSSFANGRYEVKSLLGEGGKKLVYLAHDSTLDRDIAFGLIKADGLDAAARQRVTREAQAMGRLGDHPNIMPIFDLGEENGQPFMVQPLMGGGDVEELIEAAEDGKLTLPVALKIAIEICRGLEFAHEMGIIHRDLKPGNIWLTDDGTSRIGDFGLALSLDRSRLTQEKMMVGTVSYMPPEQATGGDITPKADLYSLGAMLYEMITGRPPFMGDDDIAIIGQHINTPPVAPQWHRPEIPATLDSLIMRLLSKNPAERPGAAADVRSALEAIDISTLDADGSSPSPPAGEGGGEGVPGSLDSMAGGVFVGRQREMDKLKAALENALSGRGGMVTLVGEPGIGKTRISLELETYAGLRNAQVLWGRCYEGGGAPPYWPWVQTIRSYVSTRDPEELRAQMGSTASVISEIVEEVKERLPGLSAPPALEDPESARFRLFDSITTFLKNAGQVQPIVLILDDLHWADKPSLMMLEFFAHELASSRILIIGTYRDMELNRRHPLSITLGDLTRERLFERILLRGLARSDVSRFIELAADVKPSDMLVETIHTQTEGNPLFVTEVIRLLVQSGELTQKNMQAGRRWSVQVPEGVREVIGRRLDQLSERTNETLAIASIIGRQFTLALLKRLINDLSEERLLDLIDEALGARVIEEVPAEVDRYQFSHALFQETLLDEISLTRRVRMHARVAEAMEEEFGEDAEAHAPELVPHFEQAQTIIGAEKLVHYAILAGRQALAKNAFEEALDNFETARQGRPEDEMDAQIADIEYGLARSKLAALSPEWAFEVFGHMQNAFDYYSEAGEKEKAVQVAILPINPRPGSLVESIPMLEKVRAMVDDDDPLMGPILARYGYSIGRESDDIDTAFELVDQALEIAEATDDDALRIWTHTSAINIGQNHLKFERAEKHGKQAIELTALPGSPPSERARAINYLGMLYTSTGTMSENVPLMREGLEAAERSRIQTNIVEAAWALGMALISRGELEEAMALNERGLAIYGIGGRLLSQRVRLDLYRGDFQSAREHVVRLDDASQSASRNVVIRCIFAPSAAMYARISGDLSVLDGAIEKTRAAYENANVGAAWVQSGWAGVGLVAAALGDEATCRDIYENSVLDSGTNVIGVPLTIDRCLGIIAIALGRTDDAIGHFEDSLGFTENGRNVPEYAWAASDLAELLTDRNTGDDHDRAMTLQDEAIATAQKLNMTPLLERVLAQRDILGA